MSVPTGIAGIVLAGGRATRLGGGDKPLRTIAGRPMLALVVERLAAQVDAVAISANGDPARFAAYGLPVLADDGAPAGPLAGIVSGMRWARTTGAGRLLSVAGDTPFFPTGLAAAFTDAVAGRAVRVAVATSGGRRHPVVALWPVSLEPHLARFLAEGRSLSVAAFLERHDTLSVDFPATAIAGQTVDPFFNVNTPEDLARAESIARSLYP